MAGGRDLVGVVGGRPTVFCSLWMNALVPIWYATIDQKSRAGVSAGIRSRYSQSPFNRFPALSRKPLT